MWQGHMGRKRCSSPVTRSTNGHGPRRSDSERVADGEGSPRLGLSSEAQRRRASRGEASRSASPAFAGPCPPLLRGPGLRAAFPCPGRGRSDGCVGSSSRPSAFKEWHVRRDRAWVLKGPSVAPVLAICSGSFRHGLRLPAPHLRLPLSLSRSSSNLSNE